jgi:hypothetical protein
MITFAQKPGLFSYWVTHDRYVELAGRYFLENTEIQGYGRLVPAQLLSLWQLPFIKIFKDGDHWCALVGDDIQEGTAEFTPITDRKEYDQITDFGHAYVRAHPETKVPDRFMFWEPHEIQMMSVEARAGRSHLSHVSQPK